MAHASDTPVLGPTGCVGEYLPSVLDAVLKFATDHPYELIVLEFGHYWSFSNDSPFMYWDPGFTHDYIQLLADTVSNYSNAKGKLQDPLVKAVSVMDLASIANRNFETKAATLMPEA